MAIKKKQEAPAVKPAVSRIPMPPSDSALVIDLPDGQKLVVGKMEHGTVIEVATWRGTGRPDSRTNRMMLGMANAELEATIEAAAASEAPVKDQELKSKIGTIKKNPKQLVINIFKLVFAGIKWLFNFKDQFGDGSTPGKQTKIAPETKGSDVDAINSIEASTDSKAQNLKFDFKSKFKKREARDGKSVASSTQMYKDGDLENWLDQIMVKAQEKAEKSAAKSAARKPDTARKKTSGRG
jgi:hypothetical protein